MRNFTGIKPEDFFKIIAQLPDAYLVLDRDFTIRAVSDLLVENALIRREDVVGKYIFDVFPENPETHQAQGVLNLKKSLNWVLEQAKPHTMPVQRYDLSNPKEVGGFTCRYWSPTNSPICDESGKVIYIIHRTEDVTELIKNRQEINELNLQADLLIKREQKAFRQIERQRDLFSACFMQAPFGVSILLGKRLEIETANTHICDLWGRKAEDVLYKPLFAALPELSGQGYEAIFDGVFSSGKPYVGLEQAAVLERKGKRETAYFDFTYYPLRNAENEVFGIIASAIEVSERVRSREKLVKAARKLRQKNRELQRINADLDSFVQTVSHDLRTPVFNLEGLIYAFRETAQYKLDEEEAQMLGMMEDMLVNLKRNFQDLLEIIQFERGDSNEIVAKISIADITKDILEDLQPLIRESKAEILIDFKVTQLAYRKSMLRSILYNLLSNALKYRSPERLAKIELKAYKQGKRCVLSVKDNGLGLSKEQQAQLFKPFKRLHTHVQGSGVGLYNIKRYIESRGGRLLLRSQPNVGSEFLVYF